jgi:hypothetical protein
MEDKERGTASVKVISRFKDRPWRLVLLAASLLPLMAEGVSVQDMGAVSYRSVVVGVSRNKEEPSANERHHGDDEEELSSFRFVALHFSQGQAGAR